MDNGHIFVSSLRIINLSVHLDVLFNSVGERKSCQFAIIVLLLTITILFKQHLGRMNLILSKIKLHICVVYGFTLLMMG